MDRNVILAVAIGAAVSFLVWYVIKERDHFVSTTYGASCMQLCTIAHPNVKAECDQDKNSAPCKEFDRCIDECRMDQAKLDQDAAMGSGPSSDAWEGRYGKLL